MFRNLASLPDGLAQQVLEYNSGNSVNLLTGQFLGMSGSIVSMARNKSNPDT